MGTLSRSRAEGHSLNRTHDQTPSSRALRRWGSSPTFLYFKFTVLIWEVSDMACMSSSVRSVMGLTIPYMCNLYSVSRV